MAELTVLNVLLHKEHIGTITLLPGDQSLFAFTESYIDDENRATLSLSFKEAATGQLITDVRPTQARLHPFFANLLPEGPMRDYLANRANVKPEREFFLLWVLGKDLPGALEIQPSDGETWPEDTGDESGNNEDAISSKENALRFSLAGVQLKFSAINEATGGLTIPTSGIGGSWIVKLPSTKFDGVPENEYAMMNLASQIGMDIPETKLIDLSDISGLPSDVGQLRGQALAVRRFDRQDSGHAVHVEDFAQVFGVFPDKKYEKASYRDIAEVIWVETGETGAAEFIRRLVFNALIGNGDMHLKNWSLIYPDKRLPMLSPGYDFVSTIVYLPEDKMALTLSKSKESKEFKELSLSSLSRLAAKARLPETLVIDTAIETVERFRQIWKDSKGDSLLTRESIQVIEDHITQIPLANESCF